jgi:hypothetical protein
MAAGPIAPMHNDGKSPPKSPRQAATDARREREAEALRANLRKRKEQQRARALPKGEVVPEAPDDPRMPPIKVS